MCFFVQCACGWVWSNGSVGLSGRGSATVPCPHGRSFERQNELEQAEFRFELVLEVVSQCSINKPQRRLGELRSWGEHENRAAVLDQRGDARGEVWVLGSQAREGPFPRVLRETPLAAGWRSCDERRPGRENGGGGTIGLVLSPTRHREVKDESGIGDEVGRDRAGLGVCLDSGAMGGTSLGRNRQLGQACERLVPI